MSIFDRFTTSQGKRMAEDVLYLTARAVDHLTAARRAQEEFSSPVADLLADAHAKAVALDEAARRELTDLAEGRM